MRVVIGLGTNLGDRLAALRDAVARVEKIARVMARSAVYETAPVGPPQPDYLNAAILAEYTHSPRELLAELLAIEKEMGRDRSTGERWGPRVIDLDVLWIEDAEHAIIDEEDLRVPHPRLTERAFALLPLLEVAPHAIDPRTRLPFAKPCERLTEFSGSIR